MEYYAYLVSKGVAIYKFNPKKRVVEIAIRIDEWEKITYAIKDTAYHPHKMQKLLSLERTWKVYCAAKNKEITKATLIISFVSKIKIAYDMPVRLVISKFCCQLLLGGD